MFAMFLLLYPVLGLGFGVRVRSLVGISLREAPRHKPSKSGTKAVSRVLYPTPSSPMHPPSTVHTESTAKARDFKRGNSIRFFSVPRSWDY